MPRPAKKSSARKTNIFSFSVPLDEVYLIDEIDKIAQREGMNRGEILLEAIKEYWEEHRKGNYQHYIESFIPNGIQSNRQIEQEIINYFKENPYDVRYNQVRDRVKDDLKYTGKKLVDTTNSIIKKLHELEIKVWR